MTPSQVAQERVATHKDKEAKLSAPENGEHVMSDAASFHRGAATRLVAGFTLSG